MEKDKKGISLKHILFSLPVFILAEVLIGFFSGLTGIQITNRYIVIGLSLIPAILFYNYLESRNQK